jgi:ribosomal protein S18 acetylase RimI-like enzyme
MSEKNNTDFIIRDYCIEDFPAVEEIWKATGMGGAQRGDGPEVINRTLASGGKLLVMAEKNTDKVIGTSWLTSDGRRMYLHHFGIHPDFQGKGLSHQLANASIQYAKACGLQIKLEVHKDNSKASDLYKKHGFAYLGDYHVYIIRSFA